MTTNRSAFAENWPVTFWLASVVTWLLRTKNILDECETHLEGTSTSGSQVEAFLSQFLLVSLCAEMQEEFHRLVKERAQNCGDHELCSFALSSSKKLLRSVKVSELTGFVGHFGTDRKRRFSELLGDRERLQYDAAVDNRHLVAHRNGAQVTLSDLRDIVGAACAVLDAARTALMTPPVLGDR